VLYFIRWSCWQVAIAAGAEQSELFLFQEAFNFSVEREEIFLLLSFSAVVCVMVTEEYVARTREMIHQ